MPLHCTGEREQEAHSAVVSLDLPAEPDRMRE